MKRNPISNAMASLALAWALSLATGATAFAGYTKQLIAYFRVDSVALQAEQVFELYFIEDHGRKEMEILKQGENYRFAVSEEDLQGTYYFAPDRKRRVKLRFTGEPDVYELSYNTTLGGEDAQRNWKSMGKIKVWFNPSTSKWVLLEVKSNRQVREIFLNPVLLKGISGEFRYGQP